MSKNVLNNSWQSEGGDTVNTVTQIITFPSHHNWGPQHDKYDIRQTFVLNDLFEGEKSLVGQTRTVKKRSS